MIDTDLEVAYLIGLFIASIIRKYYLRGTSKKEEIRALKGPDGPLMMLVAITMLLLPLVYVFTPKLDFANYHLPPLIGWLGAPTFAIGIWLLYRSHKDLGENFSLTSDTREKPTLVTTGVYKNIRHPMYTAHLIWAIAK